MSEMNTEDKKELRVVWWNPFDFYHFNLSKTNKVDAEAKSRWPKTTNQYNEKLNRVCAALSEVADVTGKIDILCLCEITKKAAGDLRDRLFPGHQLFSLDASPKESTAQIAVIFPKNSSDIEYFESHPISVPNISKDSRSMGVLNIKVGDKVIQIIACHWTSRMSDESQALRERAGDHLGIYCYNYIIKDPDNRHIIIVGDLNDEPFDSSLGRLHTHRFRSRSQSAMHYADDYIKRLHLYNASWRLLGEKQSNLNEKQDDFLDCAGTYYKSDVKKWYNFDHVIVSGNLLSNSAPFINEDAIEIASTPKFFSGGLPLKFQKGKSGYVGLSDHLPITFTINV